MQLLGGRYELLNRLDDGGDRSAVWRGSDQELDRAVAVKLLTAGFTDATQRVLARAEASTAAQLSHPHICQVYDYGEHQTESGEHVAFLVMELLSGPTLEERLRAYAMPVRLALRIGAQVASALAAAHGSGLVHRNLKPANVMVTPTGPKLVDLVVPDVAPAPVPTSEEELAAAFAHLAPERFRGGKPKPASDLHALGLLMHRMLTGTTPWPAETVAQMLESHEYQPPTPLPLPDEVPEPVADLCRRCLAEDPHDRPTAHEAARRLGTVLGWQVSRAGEQFIVTDADDAVAEAGPPPAATEPTDPAGSLPPDRPGSPVPPDRAGGPVAEGSRWLSPQRLVER